VARLKGLQSQLSGEVKKVGQQLREAKESADNAKNVGLASRAVAEDAQFIFSISETVQEQVDGATRHEKLKCFLAPLLAPAIISNGVVEGKSIVVARCFSIYVLLFSGSL
jgi:hypothetical protein